MGCQAEGGVSTLLYFSAVENDSVVYTKRMLQLFGSAVVFSESLRSGNCPSEGFNRCASNICKMHAVQSSVPPSFSVGISILSTSGIRNGGYTCNWSSQKWSVETEETSAPSSTSYDARSFYEYRGGGEMQEFGLAGYEQSTFVIYEVTSSYADEDVHHQPRLIAGP
jgi:hypothetical protein